MRATGLCAVESPICTQEEAGVAASHVCFSGGTLARLTLTIADARDHVRVMHGDLIPDRISLYASMRNEMALIPAFLAHYRSLGYEQFIILDDGSSL